MGRPAVRVVVPAVPGKLHPGVLPAILRSGYPAEVVPVGPGDEYYRLLARLWAEQVDFVVVEHDIIVGRDTLAGFEGCGHWWCAHSYRQADGCDIAVTYGQLTTLGCTRFRAEVMAWAPGAVLEAGVTWNGRYPPRDWHALDHALGQALRGAARLQGGAHRHWPNVEHLHPARSA